MKKGWQTKTLDELCVIERGGSPRPIQNFITSATDGINWIKIGDATASGKYIYRTEEKIRPSGVKRSRMVYPNDFILSNSMSFGRPYIMKTTGCIHDGWLVLRQRERWIDQDFLYYLLGSDELFQAFDKLAAGSTVRNLNIGLVKRVEVSFPPMEDQRRIVGFLDEAFAGLTIARANAEENLRNARELFESHLQAVFSQQGDGWVETTLGEATGAVFTGPFGSLLHKKDYVHEGVPLVNPSHITESGIVPDPWKTVSRETAKRLSNYVLREGDIVIGRRGEMGRCAVVTEAEDGWLCGTGSFFIRPSSRSDARYLVRLLRSEGCKRQLEAIAGGAVMPSLSNTDLANLRLTLPSVDRQRAVVRGIDALHFEIQRLESIYRRKLAELDALKKSLLHHAFSGSL